MCSDVVWGGFEVVWGCFHGPLRTIKESEIGGV